MVENYTLPISCLLFRRSWLFPNSTTLSRVINSLFIIKTYLIRHAFVIPAKKSFCWLKVWIIINDSQLQLVFPKHRMILLKNTTFHLMIKIVCLMIVRNVNLENYANYLILTLIQNLIWILILMQPAWYFSTVGKHPTRMLQNTHQWVIWGSYREVQRICYVSQEKYLLKKIPKTSL